MSEDDAPPRAGDLPPQEGPDARRILADAIATNEIFAGLAPEARQALAEAMEIVRVPGGFRLIVEGEAADTLYVVLTGRLADRRG